MAKEGYRDTGGASIKRRYGRDHRQGEGQFLGPAPLSATRIKRRSQIRSERRRNAPAQIDSQAKMRRALGGRAAPTIRTDSHYRGRQAPRIVAFDEGKFADQAAEISRGGQSNSGWSRLPPDPVCGPIRRSGRSRVEGGALTCRKAAGTGTLHLRRAKGGTTATHPLLGDELRALRNLRRQAKSPFVFVSERNAPFTVSGFAKLVERAGIEAGLALKCHYPHMLRHACGYALDVWLRPLVPLVAPVPALVD